ncbi:hypothetical protein UFOVP1667_11 [uncultured Caudovirales phage]|uniref:Bacteriophage lambda, Stf, side tail fibre-repeat-2 n=1 Tax=uncultured Caudovirales phage TaxID=2100421 RepID=A0A6J5T7X2_9CAUD|nr:hypothetical protein UFOVP1667_11 [uncultured Caudovirales phage]
MATTTPNFGWPVPTSTDLVKDGATAIEALGDAIDASLVDLEGGTTGQILSKASNTDMDFTWITNDVGDITAVTAGTGISGGGTSGAVTVTNSMATAIDAKGDLIGGTGADTFARLAVGADGKSLIADSTAATGLAYDYKGWTLISTTSLSGASVTLSSIPQTYKSLKLIVKGMTNATADGKFGMQCNATATGHFLSGQEASTNFTIPNTYFQTQTNLTRTNTDNLFVFDFDLYTDTHNEKSIGVKYFYVGADVAGSAFGIYYSPGTAISSIKLLNSGGNLSAGTALLYGVA